MKVKFNRDVMVEGCEFKCGRTYDSDCKDNPIPAGTLESLFGVEWAEEACEEVEPEPTPPPAKKRRPAKKKVAKVEAVPESDIEA